MDRDGYDLTELRTGLAPFAFLPGDDGEQLFGTDTATVFRLRRISRASAWCWLFLALVTTSGKPI